MAKKKKKKKKRPHDKVISDDALLRSAQESLAAGKYRQAKDYFLKLHKRDPEKHTLGLVAAYEGLFEELMQKGRISDAKIILANLSKIEAGSRTGYRDFRLRLAQGNYIGAAEEAVRCLLEDDRYSGPGDYLLADALVLSFDHSEAVDDLPPYIISDLQNVHNALRHISEKNYEKAALALRPIGMRSLFSHWKLFAKGLCAFYSGDDFKARKAFERLPAGSAPAKAANPYLVLMQGAQGLKRYGRETDLLKQVCWVAGRKDLGETLPRAEYLWHVGRFRDSYKHVRTQMADFPSASTGLSQSLSTFYFNSLLHLDERRAERFLDFLFDTLTQKRHTNPMEMLLFSRAAALYAEKTEDDALIRQAWEDFLKTHDSLYGENKNIKALVYARLGEIFSVEIADLNPFGLFSRFKRAKPEVRNQQLSEWAFQKSLACNEDLRDTHFSLLRLYEKTGSKSRVNRKLDEIIKRFPDDKEALFNAGVRCIDRNAHIKGMNYLEQAMELDPLDNLLKEQFIIACIKAALRYAQKAQMPKCRELLPRALAQSGSRLDDFNRNAAFLYARWSVFEHLAGEKEAAQSLMGQAMEISPHPFKTHYFALMIAKVYGVPGHTRKRMDGETRALLKSGYAAEKATAMAEVLSYVRKLTDSYWMYEESAQASRFILKSLEYEFTRDQMLHIVDYALTGPSADKSLAQEVIQKGLDHNPDDPRFLYYRFVLNYPHTHVGLPDKNELKELERILALAEQARDMSLAANIKKDIQAIQSAMQLKEELGSFDGTTLWDDDDVEEDEFWEDEFEEEPDELA